MSSFQGLVRRNIVNVDTQFEKIAYAASNVANYNTTGYKEVRFEQMLDENGYLNGAIRKDYAPGSAWKTGAPFDVAIKGVGFIPVTSKNGDVKYTREGNFKVDKDGYLMTNDGYLVGDGIKIPANYYAVNFKPSGDVAVVSENGKPEQIIGKIPLVNFRNPEGLKSVDGNKYLVTSESGEPILMKKHTNIIQGALERSNVNIYTQVNDVMRTNASMLASFKLMKTIDDMYNKSINIQQ